MPLHVTPGARSRLGSLCGFLGWSGVAHTPHGMNQPLVLTVAIVHIHLKKKKEEVKQMTEYIKFTPPYPLSCPLEIGK